MGYGGKCLKTSNGKEMMGVVVYAANLSAQEAAGQGFLQIEPNLRYITSSRSARVFKPNGGTRQIALLLKRLP